MGNHDPYSDDTPSWSGFSPIIADAQMASHAAPSLSPLYLR
jgi:hypothetical protein